MQPERHDDKHGDAAALTVEALDRMILSCESDIESHGRQGHDATVNFIQGELKGYRNARLYLIEAQRRFESPSATEAIKPQERNTDPTIQALARAAGWVGVSDPLRYLERYIARTERLASRKVMVAGMGGVTNEPDERAPSSSTMADVPLDRQPTHVRQLLKAEAAQSSTRRIVQDDEVDAACRAFYGAEWEDGTYSAEYRDRVRADKRKQLEGPQPVAWRYRYRGDHGEEGMWKYTDHEDECNPLPSYEREPMYSAPASAIAPRIDASLTLDHAEVIFTFKSDEDARRFYERASSDGGATKP